MNPNANSNELVKDGRDIPNKGTSTGVTDTYGADLGQNATNSGGAVPGTDSDPINRSKYKEPSQS